MNKTEDKRVKYTKLFLKEALIELLKEKPLDSISTTELCKKADINRNTFYCHFNTVRDVLNMLEEELKQELLHSLNFEKKSRDTICQLFELLKKSGPTYRILLSPNGDFSFMQELFIKLEEIVIEDFEHEKLNFNEEQAKLIFEFLFFGCTAIIRRWLDTGMRQSPKEMADLVYRISNDSIKGFRTN